MFISSETVEQEVSEITPWCPREGCCNRLLAGQIICTADFHMLAGMCRGKKRLGQPEADAIQGRGRGIAYACPLCRQWHNGGDIRRRMQLTASARAAVRALRDDHRIGPLGLLNLADAWHPDNVNRSHWAEGIDQREALAAP